MEKFCAEVSWPLHDGSARHDTRANVSYMLQMLTREQGLELMEQVPCRRPASPIKSRGGWGARCTGGCVRE
jgi:hypothetical protein